MIIKEFNINIGLDSTKCFIVTLKEFFTSNVNCKLLESVMLGHLFSQAVFKNIFISGK